MGCGCGKHYSKARKGNVTNPMYVGTPTSSGQTPDANVVVAAPMPQALIGPKPNGAPVSVA